MNSQPEKKELIIVDGGSNDGTKEKVLKFAKQHENITLLDNPDKYVPFALNLGIQAAKGDPIVRLDAHTKYDADYFIKILETFENTDADI